MRVQILASAMNETSDIVKKMNISTDAVIINQTNKTGYEEVPTKGGVARIYSFKERGVGLSRNNALMRASSSLAIFADEDETFVDNYEDIVTAAFNRQPKADMIVFNVLSDNPDRPLHQIKKEGRVRYHNCLKYGAVRFAIKTHSVHQKNIFFSLLFGGGAVYSNGEDSIFIADCIKSGLKVYKSPKIIAHVAQDDSTWFNGYTDKYFIDRGVLYRTIAPRMASLYILRFLWRTRREYKDTIPFLKALSLSISGSKAAIKQSVVSESQT